MNNDQFRKLAFGAGAAPAGSKDEPPKTVGVLGSRKKASIPMTPRAGSSISRAAFAKQMAERFHDKDVEQPKSSKKIRAPKGIKLGEGYVDRAKLRAEQASDDAAATGALPVKGLDFTLLEKARKGAFGADEAAAAAAAVTPQPDAPDGADDAMEHMGGGEDNDNEDDEVAGGGSDVDDEFERLEETEVQAVAREKAKKRGQYAVTGSLTAAPGQKRSRDQILAELKAAREAAAAAKKREAESALGSRFKKIGMTTAEETYSTSTSTGSSSRIEIDSRGREVLVLVDEDGREKRKVRKLAAGADTAAARLGSSEEGVRPKEVLGMEVPEYYRKKLEAEAAAEAAKEVTIFDDVGSDYDPLAGLEEDDSEEDDLEEEEEEEQKKEKAEKKKDGKEEGEASETDEALERASATKAPPPTTTTPAAPRNYFKDGTLLSETKTSGPSLDDPHMLAVLRKAKQLRKESEKAAQKEAQSKETEREQRLKQLLQNSDRDAEDLDMGFGTNRLEDEEDLEEGGERIKLSVWGGDGDDGEEGHGGKAKRKRGPKKRKGDGNNAEDVLRVLEKRRER